MTVVFPLYQIHSDNPEDPPAWRNQSYKIIPSAILFPCFALPFSQNKKSQQKLRRRLAVGSWKQ